VVIKGSSVAREGRQGRTAPGGNQEGRQNGVKFKNLNFFNLLSYVSAYEALYLSLIAVYDTWTALWKQHSITYIVKTDVEAM